MVDKLKIFALLACLGIAIGAWPSSGLYPGGGLNFYFSASGSDGNDCSSTAKACKTIAHFNTLTLPQNAVAHFNGGDTFSGSLTNFVAGTTITSYGTGKPIISSGNSTTCATVVNIPGVTISNLNCLGGGNATNTTSGIIFISGVLNKQVPNVTISNNIVTNYGVNGIDISGTSGTAGFTNINIINNVVHDNTGQSTTIGTQCIGVYNNGNILNTNTRLLHNNVNINNNVVYNCNGNASSVVPAGGGITVQDSTTGVISNNIIHHYGANNQVCGGPTGILMGADDSFTVQFNEVYKGSQGSGGGACDGAAIDFDCCMVNSIMQYNYVHDMATVTEDVLLCGCSGGNVGALAWNKNTIRFNIIVGTAGTHPGILINAGHSGSNQPVTNSFIYNNDVFTQGGGGNGPITTSASGTDWTGTVANNIFYNTGGGGATIQITNNPSITFAGNNYFQGVTPVLFWNGTTYNSLASFRSGTGQETVNSNPTGTSADPQMNSNLSSVGVGGYDPPRPVGYHPGAGSPMLPNAGLNLTSLFSINPGTKDFYGTPISASTLPIGAGAGVLNPGSNSTVTLVQHTSNAGCVSCTTYSPVITGTTAGNLLIVGLPWCGALDCGFSTPPSGTATTSSVSSAHSGEQCFQVPGAQVSLRSASDIWYCPNIAGGTDTITIAFTTNVFFSNPVLVEVHGASSHPFDAPGTASNDAQPPTQGGYFATTGAVTANGSEFIYSMGLVAGNNITSFTFGQIQITSQADEYQISGAALSAYTNTATWTAAGNGFERYGVSVVGFK